MLNIPTDLLRSLVAAVDMRSFTKAAQSLAVTQPAVSAQVKRLQYLLGYEVLDKSAPGVSLTPRGEMVVNNARRLLSVNDEILHLVWVYGDQVKLAPLTDGCLHSIARPHFCVCLKYLKSGGA
jgi:DNA-binding transcriptional LysR family regulator